MVALFLPLFITLKQSIVKFERIKIFDDIPDTFYSTNNFRYPEVLNLQRKKVSSPLGLLAVLQW